VNPLKAPFPWFGGKSRVSDIIWDRFGNVANYVEPFAGSLAVLLGRPYSPRIETINDRDCLVANFWRALQNDPDEVAHYADNPVNEADQQARHLWLVQQEEFREQMKTDPDFYDAKIAGYWVWGQSSWIGAGWCAVERPHLGNAGTGVHRKLPHLGNAGTGVHRKRQALLEYMRELADRLRHVRVCCGDWTRILGPSPTVKLGITGVFLDPPYADEADRTEELYSTDDLSVAHAVREWALANGDNPDLRIALCGYEGEHQMPDSWECLAWKARGGYGSQGEGRGRENAPRERIWFSKHCLRPQESLWGDFSGSKSEQWLARLGAQDEIKEEVLDLIEA
jgi:site-specific DNA-adenine methylase